MKNNSFAGLMLLFFAFLLVSCSSDDSGGGTLTGTELSISDIQGTWNVTSFVFVKVCDPGVDCPVVEVDLIEEGATATFVIQNNGAFTITSTVPGSGQEIITGQMSFDEDLLVIEFDDSPGEDDYFGIQLTNNKNNLSISGPVEYDFDMDGTDEPAEVNITLVRA